MEKPIEQGDNAGVISGFRSWLRSVLMDERPRSEVFVERLSTQELKTWIAGLAEYPAAGDRCVAVLNDRRRTVTVMLINERGDTMYDHNGKRIARLFRFRELQADCRALFGADDAIVIKL